MDRLGALSYESPNIQISKVQIIRAKHVRQALMEVAFLIQKLILTIPFAFLEGALGGFSLFSGAFAFSGVWLTLGKTLFGTMNTILIFCGIGTVIVSSYRLIHESAERIIEHAHWIYDPEACLHRQHMHMLGCLLKICGVCLITGVLISMRNEPWIQKPLDWLDEHI